MFSHESTKYPVCVLPGTKRFDALTQEGCQPVYDIIRVRGGSDVQYRAGKVLKLWRRGDNLVKVLQYATDLVDTDIHISVSEFQSESCFSTKLKFVVCSGTQH